MNQDHSIQPAGASSRGFLLRLKRELARARLAHWGIALPTALGVAGVLLMLLTSWIRWRPPADARGGAFLAVLALLFLLLPLLLAFLWPFRRLPGSRALLAEAERRTDTRQLLETAADVAEGRLDDKGYSPAIMDRLLDQAVSRLTAGLPKPQKGRLFRLSLGSLVLVLPALILSLVLAAGSGLKPLALLLHPGDARHYTERAWLEVSPGNVEMPAGNPLRLEIHERGLPWRFPGELKLEIDETGDLFRPAPLVRQGDSWIHTLASVDQGFSYRVKRGRSDGGSYKVTIFHAPVLDSLRIVARAPAYTALPERELDLRSGEIALPQGSRLELTGYASAELSAAWLKIEGGDSLALLVDGSRLAGELKADEDLRLSIGLMDRRGSRTVTPPILSLRAVPDKAPQVEILAPGPDEDLNRDLLVDLELSAADDYGVASLRILAHKRDTPDTLSFAVTAEGLPAPRVAQRQRWDLAPLEPFPGDVIEYWVEAKDSRPGTPNIGRSAVQRLRVPSISEIYSEIEEGDQVRKQDMSEMLDEGRRMTEDMRRMEEELKANPEMSWERKEELQEAFRKQEDMARQLDELSQDLKDRSEKLGENEMLRQDMAEKMEKIQDLMDELRETEAGEILKKFQELLDRMDEGSLPEDLKQLRLSQEQLMEQLERTQAMLERMLREQRMDALLKQVDEMIEEQEQLRAETKEELGEEPKDQKGEEAKADQEKDKPQEEQHAEANDPKAEPEKSEESKKQDSEAEQQKAEDSKQKDSEAEQQKAEVTKQDESQSPESLEEMQKQQEELARQAEELLEKLRQEAKELAEKFPAESDSLTRASEPKSESNPSPPMRDAAEKMEKTDPDANKSQQEASERLLKLYWRMVKAMSSMSKSESQASTESLGRVTRQTLELSLREEDQQSEMQGLFRDGKSEDLDRRAARKQMNLYQALERVREDLLEASRLTMGVSARAMQQSRAALLALETSIAELEARRRNAGLRLAGESVGHLNETVIELLEGLRMEGQGGGSCNSPTESMQDILQRQEQLNRDSRSQSEGMGLGGLSMEERSQMQRLKAEQGALRDAVEDLGSGQEGMLGRMDKIVEEMKEVEKDLEGGRIDDKTLERQESIFERLLDAQRSVHQRGYKEQRLSRPGEELEPLWPEKGETADPLAKLRDEIRRGQGEAAPPEYEELIQEYYRSLLERKGEANP